MVTTFVLVVAASIVAFLLFLSALGFGAAITSGEARDSESLMDRALANLRAALFGAALLYVGVVISGAISAQGASQQMIDSAVKLVLTELAKGRCPDVHVGDLRDHTYTLTRSGIEFPSFPPGSDSWRSDDEPLVAQRIKELQARIEKLDGQLVTIVIEGSFDFRPLGPTAAEFGGSNVALARKRAETLKARIEQDLPGLGDQIQILTRANGPRKTHRDTLTATDIDAALAEDRRASVFLGIQTRFAEGDN